MRALYIILSLFCLIFAPHILESLASLLNELLYIDINGWFYWFLGLIILNIFISTLR